jgi:hypothetical protein
MRRAARAVLAAALGATSLGAQCQHDPSVTFEIVMPSAVADQAQWMEVGVLPGPCPPPDQLAGGIPRSGTVTRIAFQKGDTSPPAIGDLKKGPYAFAAVARGADCSVLATGCTRADVTETRDVSIQLGPTSAPSGACAAGESCVQGRCAPNVGGGDPTLGAGCSMDLVGAGPLGDPLQPGGSDVSSAPAIAVTESGFLVAYREYDQLGGRARLTLAAIDPQGGITIAPTTTLPGQCPNQDESDAIGLGYLAGAGVVASARPACSQPNPGFDTFQVDARGAVKKSAFNAATNGQPRLSNAHALALTGSGSGWLAYVDQGGAQVAGLTGLLTQAGATPFGDVPPHTLAQVAVSDKMVALLAAGTGQGAPSPSDAGALEAGPAGDAAASGSTLRLQLGTSPGSVGPPYETLGAWGALASEGSRAYVLAEAPGLAQPTSWFAMELGAMAPVATDILTPPGQGDVAGGDVAFHGDFVTYAVEQQGSIAVVVYDHASTTPTFLRTVLLSDDPRIPSQATVRDGRVAVAANDSRVLVVWTTAATLGPSDPLGAYALYACSP